MKRTAITFLISAVLLLPSCTVWKLSYNGAQLHDDYALSIWEISGGGYMKKVPLDVDLSVGFGGIIREGADFTSDFDPRNPETHDFGEEYRGVKVGLSSSYYFSRGRFQPFLGCGLNGIMFDLGDKSKKDDGKNKISEYYLYAVPHVGARMFFSRKFGIQAKAGYYFGKMHHSEIDFQSASGLHYSLGLTITF